VGDCLCASPDGAMTAAKALPLCDAILAFPAQQYVEGHHPAVTSRTEMEEYVEKIRQGARGVAADPQDEDATYVPDALKGARGRLEPWGPGDRHVVDQALGEPAMMEPLGGPETAEKIAKRQTRYEQPRSGQYKIVVGGKDAGWVGYWDRLLGDDSVVYEVGWSVLPAFQGGGVASPATAELLALARAEPRHRYAEPYPSD